MADLERSPESGSPELLVEMGRLKSLSDGVFAVALTLLVLDIRIPQDALIGDLPTKLIANHLINYENEIEFCLDYLASQCGSDYRPCRGQNRLPNHSCSTGRRSVHPHQRGKSQYQNKPQSVSNDGEWA